MTDESNELFVTTNIRVPLREFSFEFIRSSGPGGQNVNKVASKARMRWKVTETTSLPEGVKQRFLTQFRTRITEDGEFITTSQRFRDQPKNEADCLEKLREMLLAVAKPPELRRKTKPTRGSKERRLRTKKDASEKKQRRQAPRLDD